MDIHDQPTESLDSGNGKPGSMTPSADASGNSVKPSSGLARRKLLVGAAVGIGGVAFAGSVAVGAVEMLRDKHADVLDENSSLAAQVQIGHLMRRVGFGSNPTEKLSYTSVALSDAVESLINYQSVSDDALEQRLSALKLDLSKVANQQRWWLLRMAWTQRPLLEKMTLFWHGHFVSSYTKVGGPQAFERMMVQNQFLRAHAFDTFDNLLTGITSDPAMLVYLDLTTSTKKSPNENFSRELMELFTLGLGQYTQQDVHNGALALTGWHVIGHTAQSHYLPQQHTTDTTTYLGRTGQLDYKDIVSLVANHPSTPWFISKKLFTFFAYENPSKEDLQPLVDAYNSSKHNMGAVMKALLLSPQFLSAKAYRNRVKSPTEFAVGAYRNLNASGDGAYLPRQTTIMGQTLLNPPNVAGWPGDQTSALWLNSGTWIARVNYIDYLLRGRVSQGSATPLVNLQQTIDTNHLDSPEHFVDYFASFLLDGNLATQRKQQLVDYFMTKDQSKARVTLTNGQSYPLSKVRGALYLMMSLPEYHLN